MDTTHRTGLTLPAHLRLRDRTPRGWERDAVELVAIPDGADPADVDRAQAGAEARGQLGPHTAGVLLLRTVSRPVPARKMAEQMARGRPVQPTRKTPVWEPHRVVGGKPGPILGLHERFDDALRALLRQPR